MLQVKDTSLSEWILQGCDSLTSMFLSGNVNDKVFNVAIKPDAASEDSQKAISILALTAAIIVSYIRAVLLYRGTLSNPCWGACQGW